MTKIQRRKNFWGYLFILPNFIGFFIFMLIPIVASLFFSFTNYDIISRMDFIGFKNYIELFLDKRFITTLINTLYFTVLTVPLGAALALLVAVWLNRGIRFIGLFRTCIFIPVVTSTVAVSLVWGMLYDTNFGLINAALENVGIKGVGWLTDKNIAMISIAIMSIWKGLGYNMTIFLAGLQGIPNQLYEAATIDGASTVQKFFKITLPLLRPTTYFIVLMSVIGSLQVFDQVYIMTNGGPIDATKTVALYLYENAFTYYKMGYASAIAYVLFIIVFILSLIQVKTSKRWSV